MRDGGGDAVDRLSRTEAVSHIRQTTRAADPHLHFVDDTGVGEGDETIPGGVVRTIAAAAAEAVRNSGRHAHADTPVSVSVAFFPGGLRVTIADDGGGFDPATVPADRLGIAVSIRRRMSEVGGSAVIDSAPTHGTRVLLEWGPA